MGKRERMAMISGKGCPDFFLKRWREVTALGGKTGSRRRGSKFRKTARVAGETQRIPAEGNRVEEELHERERGGSSGKVHGGEDFSRNAKGACPNPSKLKEGVRNCLGGALNLKEERNNVVRSGGEDPPS